MKTRKSSRRPPLSAPRAAAFTGGLFYLFWGGLVPVTVLTWGLALRKSYDLVGENFVAVLLVAAGPVLVIVFGIRSGAVWLLKLFRVLVYLGLVIVVADLVAAVAIIFGLMGFGTHASRSGGEYRLLVSAIILTLGVVLFRKMRRVRWLDPYSTPEEWETPVNRAARRPMSEYIVWERLKEKAKGRTR